MSPPTGPHVAVTLDAPPPSLEAPQRLLGRLLRVIPGPDRPDYCLVMLDRSVRLRVHPEQLRARGLAPDALDPHMTRTDDHGVLDVQIWVIAMCSAWVGVPFTAGMRDVPTQVAGVLDNRVLHAPLLDMAAIWPVGMATTTELSPGTE